MARGERREREKRGRGSVASHTKTIADMLKYQSTFCYSSAGAQLEAGVALALGLARCMRRAGSEREEGEPS